MQPTTHYCCKSVNHLPIYAISACLCALIQIQYKQQQVQCLIESHVSQLLVMQWRQLVLWREPPIAGPEAMSVCVWPQPRRRHEHRVQSPSSGRGQRSVHVRLPTMRRLAGRWVDLLVRFSLLSLLYS